MLWLPAVRLVVVNVATPALNGELPSCVVPSVKVTVPVGVPAVALTVAVNVRLPEVELGLSVVVVFPFCTV